MNYSTPVILFTYARPNHLKKTLACLRENNVPLIYAFSDGPKGLQDEPHVSIVREILHQIDWCDIHIIERQTNLGLGKSVITGVNEILSKFETIIVFEDDIICVPGTYQYLSTALKQYADDPRVMSVTGWTHPLITPDDITDQPYFDGRAECWSWGIWRRAWQGMEFDALELMKKCEEKGLDKCQYGADLPFYAVNENKMNIWAVRLLYNHILKKGLCLRPPWSMVENIGCDTQGTNTKTPNIWKNPSLTGCPPIPKKWPKPIENKSCSILWQKAVQLDANNNQLAEKENHLSKRENNFKEVEAMVNQIKPSGNKKPYSFFLRVLIWMIPHGSNRARLLRSVIDHILKINIFRKSSTDLTLLQSSHLYDTAWYLANNPDIVQAKVDPVLHYLRYGGFEGRDPSSHFSSFWYLDTYKDVQAAGINPLLHYLKFGRKEGRQIQGSKAVQKYLDKQSELCWKGSYSSWQEAIGNCTGYDSPQILEKVKNALIKVKSGEAKYERDSVLFDEIQYSWPLLAGLLRAATSNENRLGVMDFGGSLGSSYFQNREFLAHLKRIRWCIVEQPSFVEVGRELFQDNELVFYNDINKCIKNEEINVILLSGVIQYLQEPHELLQKITSLGVEYIIVDRTSFIINAVHDRLTIQTVPPYIYSASYPSWFFERKKFLQHFFNNQYKIVAEFQGFDIANIENSIYNGFIFKKQVQTENSVV
jgi:putative methyltransferase (TIGR04325 family)